MGTILLCSKCGLYFDYSYGHICNDNLSDTSLTKPVIEYQETGWQTCPHCQDIEIVNYSCPVCKGHKIINIQTGLPPIDNPR